MKNVINKVIEMEIKFSCDACEYQQGAAMYLYNQS